MTFADMQQRYAEQGAGAFARWCCEQTGFDKAIIESALEQQPPSMKTIFHYINRNGVLPEPTEVEIEMEIFDPEAGKPTDEPFPVSPEIETPVSNSPEAPAEEAAVEEETPTPVRKCSVCREPGHTKANCPTLAADEPVEGEVSELQGDDDTEQDAE